MNSPKPPFDALRVTIRPDGPIRSGIVITRVQVRELFPHSKTARIGYGRNLHSEALIPFSELHLTDAAALKAIAAEMPLIAYKLPDDGKANG